jgi:DNA-binding NtrC family response regulator
MRESRKPPGCDPSGRTHDPAALKRVLVVDDEALIRWALAQSLADYGFAVQQAGSKAEALDVLEVRRETFDVVILDFRLPDSNDFDLMVKVKALMPSTAVIVMTAYSMPDLVQGALDLGAFRVVSKPFEIGEMLSLVRRAH